MDLFISQEDARQRTGGLVSLLVLVIVGVVFVLHCIGVLLSGGAIGSMEDHWRVAPITVPLAVGLVAIGVIARVYALREGGASIAAELGGYRVHPSTVDPRERRLLSLVDNLAMASGIPVPEVWILQDEQCINAFVAGNDPSRAVLGITLGALERLTRDELQAVLAHEFSHILSGEMSLNFSLLAWVQGILFLTSLGSSMIRTGFESESSEQRAIKPKSKGGPRQKGTNTEGESLPILGLILVMIGSVFSIFGRVFQGAICREREVYADASAIGFTNNAPAMVRALKKMAGMENGSLLMSPNASQVGHLFFGQAAVGIFSWLFPTHPAVEDRIRLLEPDWSGDFLKSTMEFKLEGGDVSEEVVDSGIPRMVQPLTYRIAVADQLGASFGPTQLIQAGIALHSLRKEWKALTLTKVGVKKLALELCKPPKLAELDLGQATPSQSLLLLDMAMPLLRRMSPEDYWSLIKQCRREVHRGEEVDVFRFMIAHVLSQRLGIALGLRDPLPVCYEELPSVWEDVRILFSLMSQIGSPTPSSRMIGYANAWSRLPVNMDALPPQIDEVTLSQLVGALRNFEQASPTLKGVILGALVLGGSYSEEIRERELVLVRLLGDAMGAPTPPVLRPNAA